MIARTIAQTNRTFSFLIVGTLLLLGFLVGSIASTQQAGAVSAAGFDAGSIISDSIFTNSDSMSAGQIQQFLNSKVTNCDTYGTQPSEYGGGTRAQWAASRGYSPPFTCIKDYSENGLTAAQIIYNAGKKYQINPQVLIVLLQKEQGLITDTWPLSLQYRSATGYGCPDTAPCDSQYYGLTNQLNWAAKMFSSIMSQNPNWYTPYTVGSNTIYWNPNYSCGTSNVIIKNLATAALYSYTPYRPNQAALNAGYGTGDSCSSYGNRNFYLYFTDWFGSTYSPSPVGAELYTQQSTGQAFLVTNGVRYRLTSWDMITNYGLNGYGFTTVSDTVIQNLTDGGVLGNLIWDNTGVYLVNNGTRYHASLEKCTAWGLDCLNGSVVKGVGSLFQTSGLKQGGSLSNVIAHNNTLYKVEGGKKLPVANTESFTSLGLPSNSILYVSQVNAALPLGRLLITTPGVVTLGSSMYYFDGSNYFKIQSPSQYYDWALQSVRQISTPASSYDTTPPTNTNLSSWIIDDSKEYVIDNGRKIEVPQDLEHLIPSTVNKSTQPSAVFNNLRSEVLKDFVDAEGSIFAIDTTGKRHVPTYSDYVGLKVSTSNTTKLSKDKISSIPQGQNILANGRVVSVQDGTGRAFVVSNGKLVHIPGPDIFGAYKFDWGNILQQPTSILSSYPIDSTSLSHSKDSKGNVYIVVKDKLYKLSASLAQDYGVKVNSLPTLNDGVFDNKSFSTLPQFLRNKQTGKVYYAAGGAIHHFVTYNAYVAYGGLSKPNIELDAALFDLFMELQPLY